MFRSLRFRLPALFLVGIAASLLVATALAFTLFRDYTENRTYNELQREAIGLTLIYAARANTADPQAQFEPGALERATGDLIFYTGVSPFPGQDMGLRTLPRGFGQGWWTELPSNRNTRFEFTPPGDDRVFLAVARPLELGPSRFGAIVVASPKAELREQLVSLLQRVTIAFAGALFVAALLGWYLTRRIVRPITTLANSADEVARGHYAVAIPDVPRGDEIGHLSDRFRQMAARLGEADERERNFLMSVSHELRTPLTAIRGHVEALREGVVEDPELRAESLDVIAREASRLERLVGDVLDLAKLDADRFTVLQEEVDMRRLTEQAYHAFTEEARRRAIEYRHDVKAQPVILTDGDRVLQIISNLLSNAFRWTPDGGRIELTLAAQNGAVEVAVSDSGPGINPEEQERIFRPFVSAQDVGGTGLGLTIASELARALGGRIELETEPGKGSCFQLVLPAF